MPRLFERSNAGTFAQDANATQDPVATLSCRFTGRTVEYFEIWIINQLLVFCTLGLFRPWAVARRRQYFYSRTSVGQHQLDYWALPKRSFLWAFFFSSVTLLSLVALVVHPEFAWAYVGLAAVLYPAYRLHSLKSAAAATSFRGRRFGFKGKLIKSYFHCYIAPPMALLLGILPFGHALRSCWSYRYQRYHYGDEKFVADFKLRSIWSLVLLTAISAVVVVLLVLLGTAVAGYAIGGPEATHAYLIGFLSADFAYVHVLAAVAFAFALTWPLAFFRASYEKLVLESVRLEAGVGFESEISSAKLTSLYFFNALAIVASLGFAIPWATIRVAKYRASVTRVICYTNITRLVGDQPRAVSAVDQVAADIAANTELKSLTVAGSDQPKKVA